MIPWIRPFHRWVSIVFTLTVIANFVALAWGSSDQWLYMLPLPPLLLLMLSGLYLFVLPYAIRWRNGQAGFRE